MSKQHDGGPAFPHLRRFVTANTYEPISEGGMTLRDFFAAKAMPQTMIEFENDWDVHAYEQDTFLQWAAQRAYAMADAMLAARNAKEGA